MSFAKLFSSITESSIWNEDEYTRLLWITMLARADGTGFVEASVPGLARIANISLEQCEKALEILSSPDRYSKDLETHPENEGRRIIKAPGGWLLINYQAYRDRRDDEARREYMRNYMREYRSGKHPCKQSVNNVSSGKPGLAQAEAEAEAEADISLPKGNSCVFSQKLHDHFRKRESTEWTAKERNAYKRAKAGKSDEEFEAEIDEVIAYEEQAGQYRVRALYTLLNKWEEKVSESRMADATRPTSERAQVPASERKGGRFR